MGQFIQVTPTTITGSGISSLAGTFPSQTTSGNMIVVCVSSWTGVSAPSFNTPTDNAGNTFSVVATTSRAIGIGNSTLGMWFNKNISGNAAHKVTVSLVSGTCNISMAALEYSGAEHTGSFDLSSSNNTGASTTPTANTITPISPSTYIACMLDDGNATLNVTNGTERREIDEGNSNQTLSVAEQLGKGSSNITWSRTGDTQWATIIANFIDATSEQTNVGPNVGLYRRDRAKAIAVTNGLV